MPHPTTEWVTFDRGRTAREPASVKAPMPMPSVVLTGPPWGMNFLGAAARGALWSLLGLASARAFFPDNAPVLAVVLVALGQSSYVQALLDRNRQEVYGGAISARRANLRMARELFGLFLGIYAAYVFAVSLVAPERLTTVFGGLLAGFQGARLSDVDFGTFGTLMAKNGAVLMASFLISTLYQHGGILLVLAWNAARWGVVIGSLARAEYNAEGLMGALVVAAVLPHLLLEALAYVIAAMGGAFLGRGVLRHKIGTRAFESVGFAVLILLLTSTVVLVLASFLESALEF